MFNNDLIILLAHFRAQSETDNDTQLNFKQFCLACNSLSKSHMDEHLQEEQLKIDFETLDVDKSNSISFLEVCMVVDRPCWCINSNSKSYFRKGIVFIQRCGIFSGYVR